MNEGRESDVEETVTDPELGLWPSLVEPVSYTITDPQLRLLSYVAFE